MRHQAIKRAEADYESAFELYYQIKKIHEILLSILGVIYRNVNDVDKAREYSNKAWSTYTKSFNAPVFGLLDINGATFEGWFEPFDSTNSKEDYKNTVIAINEQFDIAKRAQIQVVKEKKEKLDFEKS